LRTATGNEEKAICCYSETERDNAVKGLGGKPEITRFKGLGEELLPPLAGKNCGWRRGD